MSRQFVELQFGSGDEEAFMYAMESARFGFLMTGGCLGYTVNFGPVNSSKFVSVAVDYDDETEEGRAFLKRMCDIAGFRPNKQTSLTLGVHFYGETPVDTQYTLTPAGREAYERAMTNKLNGEVKAGEDKDASGN